MQLPLILSILSQTSDTLNTMSMVWEVIQPILVIVGTVFVGFVGYLAQRYAKKLEHWVAQKTGSAFLGELAGHAAVVVAAKYQSKVRAHKKAGTWTDVAKVEAHVEAKSDLLKLVDRGKLVKAAGELGVGQLLGHHIEAAVHSAKIAGKKAAPQGDPTKS